MATQTESIPTLTVSEPPVLVPYRLTVRQFRAMIGAGVFPEGVHVELLDGILVENMTSDPPHVYTVGQLSDILRRLVPPGWFVSEEKPMTLGRSWLPEPDLSVIRGARIDYVRRTPTGSDLALAVEVADTTYRKDRGPKWQRYAAKGVPTFWIIDLPGRRAEVFTDPEGQDPDAAYRTVATFGPDDEVPLVIEGREVGRLALRDILPPQ